MTNSDASENCPIFDKTKTLLLETPIQCGTSTTFVSTATADKKFLSYYINNTAATGDNRTAYLRLKLSGGGGGEAARIYTNVEANSGTCHGAHISLDFLATAGGSECSGLGVGVRGTLHIPNVASWAPTGTYAAGMFEIYSDGTASDPAGMTELSVLRLCNSGNATGMADVDTDAFLFSVQGFTAATGDTCTKMFMTGCTVATLAAATSAAFRIKVGSTTYYIPLATAI